MRRFLPLILIFLTACTPQPSLDVEATPQHLTLYIAPATEKWIPLVYDCADRTQIGLVSRTQDIDAADISLRLIAPKDAQMPIYQIGEVELLVAGNAANLISALTRDQIVAIFEGKIRNWAEIGGDNAEFQLWVYAQNDDLQVIFNETLLGGNLSSSLARQAQNQDEMRREIAKDTHALGIISRVQAEENLRVLYSLGHFPVLAILKEAPQGNLFSLLACLQEE